MFPALSLSPKSHGTSENSTVLERRYGSRSIPVNSRVIWRSRVEVRRDSPDKYVWQFFHTTKNTPLRLFFFLPLFFPRFSPRTRFFFHLFEIFFFVCGGGRDLDFLEHVRGVFHNDRKGKKPKNTQRARAKRRKRRSDQTRGNVFYSFFLSLSLSLSLYVCVYFIITKRELKMVSNYIFYAYVATTPASFSTAGIRNPSVRDRSALSSLRGAKSRKRRRCTQKLTSLSTRRLL